MVHSASQSPSSVGLWTATPSIHPGRVSSWQDRPGNRLGNRCGVLSLLLCLRAPPTPPAQGASPDLLTLVLHLRDTCLASLRPLLSRLSSAVAAQLQDYTAAMEVAKDGDTILREAMERTTAMAENPYGPK